METPSTFFRFKNPTIVPVCLELRWMASTAHPVDASRYVAYFFYRQILVYYVSSQSSNYESPSRTPWGVAFQTT
jgi:hypothetical protein